MWCMDANAPDENSRQTVNGTGITGWLDRANFKLDPDILKGEDWLGVMAWIKYCAAHPLDKLSTAVGALEQELMARHPAQSKSKSEEKDKAGARTKLRIGAQPFHFRLSVLAQGTDVGADLKLNRPIDTGGQLAVGRSQELRL